jgi:hypothetical protein
MAKASIGWIAVGLALAGIPGRSARAIDLRDFEVVGVGAGTPGALEVMFNPREYTVTKQVPWEHHEVGEADAAGVEFTDREPYRVRIELFFDTSEAGTSVEEVTKAIEALALPDFEQTAPPPVLVRWGNGEWTASLLEAETEILDVAGDGTPIAARMKTLWSTFADTSAPPPPLPIPYPTTITTEDGEIPGDVDATSIELLTILHGRFVKSQSIDPHDIQGLAPRVDFAAGDRQRLRMDLLLDTSESKEDVRPLVERVASLSKLPPGTFPSIEVGLGVEFLGVLESSSVEYTMFMEDGTPVRAVVSTTWKEFRAAAAPKGNPRH